MQEFSKFFLNVHDNHMIICNFVLKKEKVVKRNNLSNWDFKTSCKKIFERLRSKAPLPFSSPNQSKAKKT